MKSTYFLGVLCAADMSALSIIHLHIGKPQEIPPSLLYTAYPLVGWLVLHDVMGHL